MTSKYETAKMPASADEALRMASDREGWAKAARDGDKPGTAHEFELAALLLRDWAGRQ